MFNVSTQFIANAGALGRIETGYSNPSNYFKGCSALPSHLTPTPSAGVLSDEIPTPSGSVVPPKAGGRQQILKTGKSLPPTPSSLSLSEEHGGGRHICKAPSTWES